MRITHGRYELAKGLTYYTPQKIYEYAYDEKKLIIHGIIFYQGVLATKIGGKIISLEFSSPFEDVIRIRAMHHGRELTDEGKFPLDYERLHDIQIQETEESISLTTGKLTVKLEKIPGMSILSVSQGKSARVP